MTTIRSVHTSAEFDPAATAVADLLLGQIYPDHSKTTGDYLDGCRNRGSQLFAMFAEHELVAAAAINHTPHRHSSYLQDIAVHPAHRKHGHARVMVAHVAEEAYDLGSDRLTFIPNVGTQKASVPFFTKLIGRSCIAGHLSGVDISVLLERINAQVAEPSTTDSC